MTTFPEMLDACREVGRTNDEVYGFQGPFRFLSNFWPSSVVYRGRTFPCVENAYQASKQWDNEEYVSFLMETTPSKAKKMSRAVVGKRLPQDWRYNVGLYTMRQLVLQKFSLDDELFVLLMATKRCSLIEANSWNDAFWGVIADTREGDNNLGEAIMKVREVVRDIAMLEVGKREPQQTVEDPEAPCTWCKAPTADHPRIVHPSGVSIIRRCDGRVVL